MHLLPQSNVSIDKRSILLVFFFLVKGVSWLGVFCFGSTDITDNSYVVLFSYNSHEVVLVSLDVSPYQYGWTFYKTSLDFPNLSSHPAIDLLYFPLIYGKTHCIYIDCFIRCTPKVLKKSKWKYISQILKNWHLNQCTMKVVSLVTMLDVKPLFLGKRNFCNLNIHKFFARSNFPLYSQIVKDSQIFRLNKFFWISFAKVFFHNLIPWQYLPDFCGDLLCVNNCNLLHLEFDCK